MKNIFGFCFTVLFPLFIVACSNSNEEPFIVDKKLISAKWEVYSLNGNFESFEFNTSGNFIAIEKTTAENYVHFGKYQIVNESVNLDGLGTVNVNYVDDNNLNFNLMQDNLLTKFNLKKVTDIITTDKTELLCKTWGCKLTVNEEEKDITVLFSKAKTYYMNIKSESEEITKIGTWEWNFDETGFTYSLKNGNNGAILINELSANKFNCTDNYENESYTMELAPIKN